jgi:hypothetical protein
MWINAGRNGLILKPRLSQIMANKNLYTIIETIFYVIKTRYLKVSELEKDDSNYILKLQYLLASEVKKFLFEVFFTPFFLRIRTKPAEELM